MSYDVDLYADLGGPEPLNLGILDWNYTWNIYQMTQAAGWGIGDFDGRTAADALAILEGGMARMRADPAKFRALNPENGWGDYDRFMDRLEELVVAFRAAPKAIVRVS